MPSARTTIRWARSVRRPLAVVGVCLALATLADHAWLRAAEADPLSGKILLLAAASTTDAVEELRTAFIRLHPGVSIRTSYAASSTLAQQIAAGAQADLFLSASSEWVDFLAGKQLVERRRDLLGNRLVIVTAVDSPLKIAKPLELAQAGIRRLALADPKSVPAGVYARQALEKLGIWNEVAGRVAGAADVRQALHFVETGAADAGMVYATDAAASKAVRVASDIPSSLTAPIRYPLVLVKAPGERRAAGVFYEFLGSDRAAAVFRRYGFVAPPPTDTP